LTISGPLSITSDAGYTEAAEKPGATTYNVNAI